MPVQVQITYSYDLLDRLVEARYPNGGRVRYTYDAAGNRTAVAVSSGSAPAAQICPQCGSSIAPNLQFCTNCGKKLK